MQIVIDIPEETYNNILNNLGFGAETETMLYSLLYRSVAQGTPLPKGHGRLIDEHDLIFDDIECIDGNTYMIVHAPCVDNASTIIKAESED